jgi:hypothetical protein
MAWAINICFSPFDGIIRAPFYSGDTNLVVVGDDILARQIFSETQTKIYKNRFVCSVFYLLRMGSLKLDIFLRARYIN